MTFVATQQCLNKFTLPSLLQKFIRLQILLHRQA
jgi:hypothetical protein